MLHWVTLPKATAGAAGILARGSVIIPKLIAFPSAEPEPGTSSTHLPNRTPAPNAPRSERMATCPECDAEIEVDEFDVDKGDLLSCPECGSSLEVTGVAPIELDVAGDEDDDDDEDEEEEEAETDELGIEEEDDTEEEEDWDE